MSFRYLSYNEIFRHFKRIKICFNKDFGQAVDVFGTTLENLLGNFTSTQEELNLLEEAKIKAVDIFINLHKTSSAYEQQLFFEKYDEIKLLNLEIENAKHILKYSKSRGVGDNLENAILKMTKSLKNYENTSKDLSVKPDEGALNIEAINSRYVAATELSNAIVLLLREKYITHFEGLLLDREKFLKEDEEFLSLYGEKLTNEERLLYEEKIKIDSDFIEAIKEASKIRDEETENNLEKSRIMHVKMYEETEHIYEKFLHFQFSSKVAETPPSAGSKAAETPSPEGSKVVETSPPEGSKTSKTPPPEGSKANKASPPAGSKTNKTSPPVDSKSDETSSSVDSKAVTPAELEAGETPSFPLFSKSQKDPELCFEDMFDLRANELLSRILKKTHISVQGERLVKK
ncbi:MAG: hypothetical protein LBJ09_02910 [Clostridiales bacterium]|nr:hypothetical protein [Clostridiales bacterium]